MKTVLGQYIDISNRRIYPAEVFISKGVIEDIKEVSNAPMQYLLPGFVDAHIHIESSMLVPYEFARIALTHGTVATISDPHEIANVAGIEGVYYMIENARSAILKFHFGAPSCVPATSFETSGASIDDQQVKQLLASDDIYYLSEMMNYPGVLHQDPQVMAKIRHAQDINKPIDGHAPGLRGADAFNYIAAGISTDHECYTLPEAVEKLSHGMKIIIREGSAAKNYNALHPLISDYADKLMFCSDDKHPDDLIEGHINRLVIKSLEHGYDLFDVLKIACINPVNHYNMRSGIMQIGDPADFIVVDNLVDFNVLATYIDGINQSLPVIDRLPNKKHEIINNFKIPTVSPEDFKAINPNKPIPIINAIDGELITEKSWIDPPLDETYLSSNVAQDILKICVINRYNQSPISTGFIKNFGLQSGAIASTVAHDSHNIVVVGVDDEAICKVVNILVASKGGLSASFEGKDLHLPLPIAGLMSDQDGHTVAKQYSQIDAFIKGMGCTLTAPFMTLSFMALLVIPKIKISDKGMFDAERFCYI